MEEKEKKAFEFLIEEYKEFSNTLHINEERGEKRIEFFLTLSTAVLGAIGFFIKEFSCIEARFLNIIYLIIIFFLIGLIAIGIIIQKRLSKRNNIANELMSILKEIRENIRERTDPDYLVFPRNYSPFKNLDLNAPDSRRLTSLSHVAAVMVCILIGVAVAFISSFILFLVTPILPFKASVGNVLSTLIISVISCTAIFVSGRKYFYQRK